jgi:hypothetical protein
MNRSWRRLWVARGVAVAVPLALAMACIEVALRHAAPSSAAVRPIDDVLFLTPDPHVGWTLARDFEFEWAGRNPYCVEFTVEVKTNSHGFRDKTWTLQKPSSTIRIAVIGDSFVEAIQVPDDRTATRLLEQDLAARFPGRSFETMNFGVSNYSFGQFLIVYDTYVRQFKPDYVVTLAAYLNFNRTNQGGLSSALQPFYALNIRPSFAIGSGGTLITVPAREHEAYARRVDQLIETEYGADRARTVEPLPSPFHLTTWLLKTGIAAGSRLQHWRPSWGEPDFDDVGLNYRIVQALHEHVAADGAVLLFADAFGYLERYGQPRGSGRLAEQNERFVESLGARYLDVSPTLAGTPADSRFACDMHFSVTENRQLARALSAWFIEQLERPSGSPDVGGATP